MTFITFLTKCYYTCDQLLHLCLQQPLLSPYFILIFLFHVIQCRVQIKLLLLLLRHNRQHYVTPLTLLGVLKNEQYPPFKILKIEFINANNKMKVEMCREIL